MPLSTRIAEVQIALMTLTRLPIGEVADPVPSMAEARWAFPLVGVVIGALTGGAFVGGLVAGLPPLVAAVLAVLAGILATGALHEDGLADCADGFGGGRDTAAKLEIMRDSRIGTYGTLALVFSVAIRVSALAVLAAPFWSVVSVAVLSRCAMVVALERMPSARPEGLGAAAAKAGGMALAAYPVPAVAVLVLIAIYGAAAVVPLAVMVVAGLIWARIAIRQIGGQTGDVLGGIQQVTEIAGLVVLSALAL